MSEQNSNTNKPVAASAIQRFVNGAVAQALTANHANFLKATEQFEQLKAQLQEKINEVTRQLSALDEIKAQMEQQNAEFAALGELGETVDGVSHLPDTVTYASLEDIEQLRHMIQELRAGDGLGTVSEQSRLADAAELKGLAVLKGRLDKLEHDVLSTIKLIGKHIQPSVRLGEGAESEPANYSADEIAASFLRKAISAERVATANTPFSDSEPATDNARPARRQRKYE